MSLWTRLNLRVMKHVATCDDVRDMRRLRFLELLVSIKFGRKLRRVWPPRKLEEDESMFAYDVCKVALSHTPYRRIAPSHVLPDDKGQSFSFDLNAERPCFRSGRTLQQN